MAVVAAGVDHAVVDRAIGYLPLLLQADGVHVGPEADGPAAISAGQLRHHAGAADAGVDAQAHLPQLLRHEGGGVGLLKGRLRVHVQVVPPLFQFLFQLFHTSASFHSMVCSAAATRPGSSAVLTAPSGRSSPVSVPVSTPFMVIQHRGS